MLLHWYTRFPRDQIYTKGSACSILLAVQCFTLHGFIPWKKKERTSTCNFASAVPKFLMTCRKIWLRKRARGYFRDLMYLSGQISNVLSAVYSRRMNREMSATPTDVLPRHSISPFANRRQFRMHPVEIGTSVLNVDRAVSKTLSTNDSRSPVPLSSYQRTDDESREYFIYSFRFLRRQWYWKSHRSAFLE